MAYSPDCSKRPISPIIRRSQTKTTVTRILSKGSELDFADYADWDETANIRDYDLLFVNLRDLEQRKDEFLHTDVPREYWRQYELPSHDHVLELITSGGDIVVTLPTTLSVQPSENQDWEPPESVSDDSMFAGTPVLNFLNWLPFEIEAEDSGGQSVDADSITDEWSWYFPDQFDWDLSFLSGGGDAEGVRFRFESLVDNGYRQALAVKFTANQARGARTTGLAPEWGTIYLIPLLDGRGFQDFSYQVMDELYPDVDLNTVGRQPDWLGDYQAPREEELEAEIERLQRKLAHAQAYKQLLWEQGDELEEIVYLALQDAGLTIEEEVPGRRDGAIDLVDRKVMLEITGTTGGIKESKLRQLQTWVDYNQNDYDEEITGLLVINHQRDRNPSERRVQLDEQREAYLDSRGLQLVTTPELFKIVTGIATGEISEDDVEAKLRSDEGIVVFNEIEESF